jgi:2-polyprenyl-3-methyl-5-hydroxy-6-metoxy-1,4-benzoquinol methylase
MNQAAKSPAYILGHSEVEIERLKTQARRIGPVTARFFREAGIAPGMRVLDVGSGPGDVAFLEADIVGETGQVLGVDRSAEALDVARLRAKEGGRKNVEFRVGDPTELKFDRPFDAIAGRYVLQFQKDPSAMLRKLAAHVRPGGLIVFHEIDWGGLSSFPAAPTYDQCCRWGAETLRSHGTESRMGMKLYSAFVGAGLPTPTLRLEALAGGGIGSAENVQLMADLMTILLPEMERLGVATAAEVGLETLVGRMNAEAIANESVLVGHNQIAAWCRF